MACDDADGCVATQNTVERTLPGSSAFREETLDYLLPPPTVHCTAVGGKAMGKRGQRSQLQNAPAHTVLSPDCL